jgi:MraZ protein
MALFLSTYTNKIDKKGRISVPAGYRAVLKGQKFSGIIIYPSFINDCIEACGIDRIERLSESIDNLDPYSEERDAFATAILGGAQQLAFDSDGRVVLPASLLEENSISEQALFIGKGATFEIWNPVKFAKYADRARDIAKKQRHVLRLSGSRRNDEEKK